MKTLTHNKPTKTGHYWLQYYNPTTGQPESAPEVVYVVFGVTHRRKVVNRVCARFWQCNLEQVVNAKWSEEIVCPPFEAPKDKGACVVWAPKADDLQEGFEPQ